MQVLFEVLHRVGIPCPVNLAQPVGMRNYSNVFITCNGVLQPTATRSTQSQLLIGCSF